MGSADRTRIACVDLPELPLQILKRKHESWRSHPVAVVADDKPDAPLLYVDARAKRLKLEPGMRHGAARNLVPTLRAGVVTDREVREIVDELTVALQTFSPRVESDTSRPGTFYVDPKGLSKIYGGPTSWARAIHQYLKARKFRNGVAIGHGRFPAFAIARSRSGASVTRSARESRQLAFGVRLGDLGVSPRLRDDLKALAIETLGDLVGLPAGDLASRFGPEAARLHALACDDPQVPMQPEGLEEPIRVSVEVDPPDADHSRLLFAIKGALDQLAKETAARSELVRALHVELGLEKTSRTQSSHHERIEPAAATRDVMLMVDLVRLRLTTVSLAAPVTEIVLWAETERANGDQLSMFRLGPRRDLKAGARALARVRAAFGERSVTRARLRDAHLPEARFGWEPVAKLIHCRPRTDEDRGDATPPLMRRVLRRPQPLASADPSTPEAGPDPGPKRGALLRLFGPYRVSGGWWGRATRRGPREVERDYYYGETDAGELLWLYYDRPRSRWFLHGLVD